MRLLTLLTLWLLIRFGHGGQGGSSFDHFQRYQETEHAGSRRSDRHVSPPWPEGYWPTGDAPPDDRAWDRSVATFHADLGAMQELVADPATDLFMPLPHGEGQTALREALLVADHNAYHLGQLVMVRRLLGAWEEEG